MKQFLVISIVALFFAGMSKMAFANENAANGAKLFGQKCAMCHAENGKGNKGMVNMVNGDISKLDLTDKLTSGKTDYDLKNVILKGASLMPSFKSSLTEKEVNALVTYVRALKDK